MEVNGSQIPSAQSGESPPWVRLAVAEIDEENSRKETSESEEMVEDDEDVPVECERIRTPRVNCPEKLVLCVELFQENALVEYDLPKGRMCDWWHAIQRAVEMFLKTKNRINSEHTYSLILLADTPTWVCGPSSDPLEVHRFLSGEDIRGSGEGDNRISLDALLQLISERCELPEIEAVTDLPPPFVVRAVCILCQPPVLPLVLSPATQMLVSSPYFFFDLVYLTSETRLPSMDPLQVGRSDWQCHCVVQEAEDLTTVTPSVCICGAVCRTLTHPLQRPPPALALHSLPPSPPLTPI
uniref:BRISC and BRCA1 A complex member 1 n=1 Tax=Eptatretus burgeri TaxID=7764 RepID=A0A8C4WX98_EPTBU